MPYPEFDAECALEIRNALEIACTDPREGIPADGSPLCAGKRALAFTTAAIFIAASRSASRRGALRPRPTR